MTLLKMITVIIIVLNLTACNKIDSFINLEIEDEPYFKYAWHFVYNEEFAQDNDIDKEAHIQIEEAWKITRGAGIVVAVIDLGNFDVNHEDLRTNIIDTYRTNYSNKEIPIRVNNLEIDSHGSTVAGLIASPVNGKGLVGAAPESKLILIQLSNTDDASIIDAFKYAKNSGAKIINCSWGTGNVSDIVASYFQELKDYGITIIFASGNKGRNLDTSSKIDESELPSVIGVGASNEFNEVASYSNYGRHINIVAPGGNNNRNIGILTLFNNNSYAYTAGTSLAAPITAGVVALMLSVNNSLTPNQIKEILIKSADKIDRHSNHKVNATNAVKLSKDY